MMGDFELFERAGGTADRTPVPAGPSVAVVRGARRGETLLSAGGWSRGDLVLSAGAWTLLEEVAGYRPQVVKRPRAVELLFETGRGRVAIRPVTDSGVNTFPLIGAFPSHPDRREAWPMRIPCHEFLEHWEVRPVPLHRPAPAHLEAGLLVFTPGQVAA